MKEQYEKVMEALTCESNIFPETLQPIRDYVASLEVVEKPVKKVKKAKKSK